MKKVPYQNPQLRVTSFLLLIVIFSCGIKKKNPQEIEIPEANPKLIFLNYTISKNENNEKNIQFINQIVTNGKLKISGVNPLKNPKKGDLKCTQLDENSNELQALFIENPLMQMVEFVNDSLSFEKKTLNLQNNEFSLRLQLHSKTKAIIISEVMDNMQQTKPLIKTKIK